MNPISVLLSPVLSIVFDRGTNVVLVCKKFLPCLQIFKLFSMGTLGLLFYTLFFFILTFIILLIKVGIHIDSQGKKCANLIENYLMMGIEINDREEWNRFNSQGTVFAMILLKKPIHLTILGIKAFSYTTLGLIIVNIVTNPSLILNLFDYFEKHMENSTNTFTFTKPIVSTTLIISGLNNTTQIFIAN